MKGLTHVYTGDGKGKTTAAVGLAVRAQGSGLRVLFVQFLKGRTTGELAPLEKLGINIVRSQDVVKFIPYMTPQEVEECRIAQQGCMRAAKERAQDYDVIILDEAIGAAATGMIDINELTEFVRCRPQGCELVLTGRDAPPQLTGLADYVSEIRAVKHPYDKGTAARRGIEY